MRPQQPSEMAERASTRPAARLTDRVALVTGAASGIGAATAARLGAEGARAILVDIDRSVTDVAARLVDLGHMAHAHVADVTDSEAWMGISNNTVECFGRVDVLVSNAFTVDVAPAHRTSRESWDRQLAVNLTAAFAGFTACLPGLMASDAGGGASVVLVSSVHAIVGLPGHPAYAASKGALVSLARQLAVDYGPDIRVNSVLPGPVLTKAWGRLSDEDRARSAQATVTGRLGDPDEVAAAIAFLASADASFVTGTSLVVDGGWSATKDSS